MYELFEHTADLGLRAEAATLDDLFADAAVCLLSAIVEDVSAIQPATETTIAIIGTDREFLLFDWLKDLLFRFEADRMLYRQFEVQVRDDGLSACARGETFDPARHALRHEVKAITYHELKVVQTHGGWLAEVIVDI